MRLRGLFVAAPGGRWTDDVWRGPRGKRGRGMSTPAGWNARRHGTGTGCEPGRFADRQGARREGEEPDRPRSSDPGFRSLSVVRKAKGLKFDFELMTESPASIVVRKIRTRRGKEVREVVARLTRTGAFTWNPRRLTRGSYQVKVSSMGLGRRLDSRNFRFRRTGSGFRRG